MDVFFAGFVFVCDSHAGWAAPYFVGHECDVGVFVNESGPPCEDFLVGGEEWHDEAGHFGKLGLFGEVVHELTHFL